MKKTDEKSVWSAFERAYELFESGNLAKARLAYEHAAQLGSIPALVNLANYYDDGTFGVRNRIRAIQLYKKAAARGSAEGAYGLAQLYRIEDQTRWYKHWLNKAAKLGDTDAPRELAALDKARRKSIRD